ncbi:MAG: hypothetical protein U9Q94_08915 [Candidatus Bipolaricaulota bacterium]|nr:hypothetical protein [Candidatus Bipolaricaulota bacterium]
MKGDTNVKQETIGVRRALLIIWLFSVALLLLMLSGCGRKTEATTPLPAGPPQASDQPSSGAGDSAGSEPATPKSAETQETNNPPVQVDTAPAAGTLSPAGEASLSEFMAKVNERLDLDEAQQDQVKSATKALLISMEQKTQLGQAVGVKGQGSRSGNSPDLTDEQREQLSQMRQGQVGGPLQVTQQLQEILTPEQLDKFQQLMEELRQEMILQRTIEQMGGATPPNTDKK